MARTRKTTADTWIDAARQTLIEEGIGGVKVDRLANRLAVTRGGFYNNFADRDELLDQVLRHWRDSCRFLPDEGPGQAPAEAIAWFDRCVARLIEADGYDHRFDLAVRDWARSERRAARAVERSDRERLKVLTRFFDVLGCGQEEAEVRARVFYYHQIGYYAIGVKESVAERRRKLATYLEILCGPGLLAAARASKRAKKSRN